MTLKDEHHPAPTASSVGVRYTTGEEHRYCSRSNEEVEPKQKWHLVVDVSGGEAKSDAIKNNIA